MKHHVIISRTLTLYFSQPYNNYYCQACSQCFLGFHIMSPNFRSKELVILLSCYFHEVLGQLKAYIFTNFHFERVLNFVIEWKIRAI